jgi:single-strand DNA-binding protein
LLNYRLAQLREKENEAMSTVNRVILLGHLGADPELRHPTDSSTVCRLSVATNRTWTNQRGERQEEVCWHRVSVWGKRGETCHRYLSKGRQVYLEGRLRSYQYDDSAGQKRFGTEIVSDNVVFLARANGQRESDSSSADGPYPEMGPESTEQPPQEEELPF